MRAFFSFWEHLFSMENLIYLILICIILSLLFILFRLSNPSSKRKLNQKNIPKQPSYPTIEISKEQVREAIRKYSDQLPKGVYRTILVKDDHSIDFNQLLPILKGIPSKSFYMSKETYDIFDEDEKHIPMLMDKVQKAVDAYYKDHQQYPILAFDSLKRVNFYLLLNQHYIDFQPEIEFYITEYDGIVSHLKPQKRGG
jgi:hypothetical protein